MTTVNEKMTALADEIRELSGTTTIKSIDAMTSDINAANIEIGEQTDLIVQIIAALEGKASEGVISTIYIGSDAPATDIGVDGDIYIVRSDAT